MPINSKTTKAELIEMIQQKDQELAELKANSYNPETLKEEHAKKIAMETATKVDQLVTTGADKLIEEVKSVTGELDARRKIIADLDIAINEKQQELQDLYGFEEGFNNLAALVAAKHEVMDTLDAKLQELNDSVVAAQKEAEQAIKDIKQSVEKQTKVIKADADIQRRREDEEYNYQLKRSRQKEMDRWEDEKAVREQELSDREYNLSTRIDELHKQEAALQDRELAVAQQEEEAKAAYDRGYDDAQKVTEQLWQTKLDQQKVEYEHKIAILEKSEESCGLEIENLDAQIESLKADLNKALERNHELSKQIVDAMSVKNTSVMYANPAYMPADTISNTSKR